MKVFPINLNNSNLETNQLKSYNNYKVLHHYPTDRITFSSNINSESVKKIIIIIGAPNSGKGTLARSLSDYFSIPTIGAGDILREEIKKGNKFGEIARQFMKNIGNVPKFTQLIKVFMGNTIKEKLKLPAYKNGFVLEGFPRTLEEAEMLKTILDAEKNIELKIVHLDVNTPLLFERCANRFMCKDCHRTYSFINPKDLPKCKCGGTLIKRDDDTPEILERRIKKYETETLPVVDYYRDKAVKITIKNANTGANKVLEKVLSKISE